jgi:beta-glucosidase
MTQGTFPPDFVWGVATSAYQIEGAVAEGGRGPSIWDTFSHTPGAVDNDDTGDVACDHYHRWREDLDLMVDLGIASYRFSVAWPRVMPDGRTVNQEGLDFYRRLVDGLLERGIRPLMTLYHWDLPQSLDVGDTGGWLSRDLPDRFVDYALVMGKELGDRVRAVTTLNEPWCSAYLGYASGEHAPGRTEDALAFRAAHHLNLAHGRAVTALRDVLPPGSDVSVALNLMQVQAASDREEDVTAAEHVDLIANRMFLDPMFSGGYSDELRATTAGLTDWSFVKPGDEAEIGVPLDSLGLNFYNPSRVSAHPRPSGSMPFPGTHRAFFADIPGPRTVMGWPIVPSGLTDLLLRVQRDGPRPGADRLPPRPRGRRPGRAAAGRRRPRVLRLDAAGQLRVGVGVREALRPGPRRLRRPATDAQGLGAVVRGRDRQTRPVSGIVGPDERGGPWRR